jgi:2-C-methyl-D-erythritol 4-phosphate cytidylyltransferase/2-C-methyl-D-erythritol 2,4-cyclodiphosphate synthase
MEVVALLLAAGRGERLAAGRPKAQVRLAGRSLLDWSACALGRAAGIDAVLPVIGQASEPDLAEIRARWEGPARLLSSAAGGATRQDSLACGLDALVREAPDASWVLVHDAARCLVEPGDAEGVLAAARSGGAAIPVVALEDTVKELAGQQVLRTLPRERLARAQTPQAFRLALLREAVEKARRDGFEGTDCASLVERLGVPVAVCPGRSQNFKVTGPEDLLRAEALLRARALLRAGEAGA